MKRIATILLSLVPLLCARAQTPQCADIDWELLREKDLSMLWTGPLPVIDREDTTALEWIERPEPLGYVGREFQRMRIHLAAICRSGCDPYRYLLKGYIRRGVANFPFEGELQLDSLGVRAFEGAEEWGGIRCKWVLKGHYTLRENPEMPGSGLLQGVHTIDIAADRATRIYYDTLYAVGDGYCNNQWRGTWRDYRTGRTEPCNWGDFRIPDSRGLDVGTGEFMPAEAYRQNGWQSFLECYDEDATVRTAARKEEYCLWWLID